MTRWLIPALALVIALAARAVLAQAAPQAAIYFLGETHDNPTHHATQATTVTALAPRALVFEMLTEAQAAEVTAENRVDAHLLETALGWADGGWPDFAMYYPIFEAAPEAAIHGAGLPRGAARKALEQGVADYFGDAAPVYGLTVPLDEEEQAAREAMQAEAHCNALPPEMLPAMVELQRLRDAMLAREALRALDATGGPVVVITGNGHARRDWGAPIYVAAARPDVPIFSLGQGEAGATPGGAFDQVTDAPAVQRDDPCAAFN
ncbi:ChaN family lipoprotein [Mesobacterium pallidum]|uniref:ChaN family lipoprotein n=1 Tax=Mesobacterium pallidum TaxID=2872037 RepID=UPI001EE287DB|nr:ChaN family lipoprotein [Mesobacterium pallidum]